MDKKLQGQVAIVTGASSGIGAGVSRSLAAAGAIVVVNHPVSATQPPAEAVLAEIKAAGGDGITYQCDVSKEDEVKKMFADVVKSYGTVDILVNNAGLQRDSPFQDMTLEQWNFVIGVNLTGQFLCAREAIREFLRRKAPCPKRSKAHRQESSGMSSVHEVTSWAATPTMPASKARDHDADEKHRPGIRALQDPGRQHRARSHQDPDQSPGLGLPPRQRRTC